MLEWIKRYQRAVSLSLGSLFLLSAIVMFFWSNTKSTSLSEEAMAQASIARMEARSSGSKTMAKEQNINVNKFYESRDKQMRYLLIVMIVGGIGFIAYGVLKKP